ncbi:hypothetical protein ACTOB_003071 [Actinoplanes oblitus]|uniref:Uncharacterized protein n=1 Tax=Actinoplanes oblitus TaxID=3040509 RepID=A0ABY8WU94_9ACTN|nr:hypothetical protein [Actinoplanes oblitus]WIM99420.1 hypothetical protein ACTOB_003071 [Actinoplanes oblitus]
MTGPADFVAGLSAPFRPPATETAASGVATTVLTSWWNHNFCDACGHTFRRGDRVRFAEAGGRPTHLAPATGCPGAEPPAGEAKEGDAAAFADGLLTAWHPAPDVPVTPLTAGNPLLAPPRGRMPRARCLFCAHTLRREERVVICPCRPAAPRCAAAVHRDAAAGLTCWESWRPDGALKVCPVTFSRLGAG